MKQLAIIFISVLVGTSLAARIEYSDENDIDDGQRWGSDGENDLDEYLDSSEFGSDDEVDSRHHEAENITQFELEAFNGLVSIHRNK